MDRLLTVTARLDSGQMIGVVVLAFMLVSFACYLLSPPSPDKPLTPADRVMWGFLMAILWILSIFGFVFIAILLA